MLKRIFLQIHWFLGISAGVVLAIMGLSGGIYCFEEDLIKLFHPQITKVNALSHGRLSPSELVEKIKPINPNFSSFSFSNDPNDAARVGFMNPIPGSDQRKFELQYLNPYTGELLGKPASEEFFRFALELHRTLAMGSFGKALTGASTLILLFLISSGIYLRWPKKQPRGWRTYLTNWLLIDTQNSERNFLMNLHSVMGTWLIFVYLLAALTGLVWSYDWYRTGLNKISASVSTTASAAAKSKSAVKANVVEKSRDDMQKLDLDQVWKSFNHVVPSYKKLILLLPYAPAKPVQILYLAPDAPHDYANSKIVINSVSGELVQHDHYAEKNPGEKLNASLYALHSGNFFGFLGMLIMMLGSLLLPFFAITGWMMYIKRRK